MSLNLRRLLLALENLAPASRARAINAVKSLFSFAQRIGYLNFNPAAAVQGPKIKNTLAERILPESQILRLILQEPHPRNRVLLRLLYAAGLRVSEICGLKGETCRTGKTPARSPCGAKAGRPGPCSSPRRPGLN
jgi:integrase/recombinase XerD